MRLIRGTNEKSQTGEKLGTAGATAASGEPGLAVFFVIQGKPG
jgi:hypothetical protein